MERFGAVRWAGVWPRVLASCSAATGEGARLDSRTSWTARRAWRHQLRGRVAAAGCRRAWARSRAGVLDQDPRAREVPAPMALLVVSREIATRRARRALLAACVRRAGRTGGHACGRADRGGHRVPLLDRATWMLRPPGIRASSAPARDHAPATALPAVRPTRPRVSAPVRAAHQPLKQRRALRPGTSAAAHFVAMLTPGGRVALARTSGLTARLPAATFGSAARGGRLAAAHVARCTVGRRAGHERRRVASRGVECRCTSPRVTGST
jgi:hypothetical protein